MLLAQTIIERRLTISDVISSPGKETVVNISMTDAGGVAGADIIIVYDKDLLSLKNVATTFLSEGMKLIFDEKVPGELALSIKGKEILNGAGPFIQITFTVSNKAPSNIDASIIFKEANVYDSRLKEIPMSLQDGRVRIIGGCLKGDADNDGVVSAKDAIIVLRISAGLKAPTPYEVCACDVNSDGAIRANDAIMVLRIAVGLEPLVRQRF